MTDAVSQLTDLYQYLQRFYQSASNTQVQAKLPQAALQLSVRIIELYQQQPHILQVQLNYPPRDVTLLCRLALQQATCLLTMMQGARWPTAVQEQLVAAALYSLQGLSQLPADINAARQGWHNPWLLTIRTQQAVLRQHSWLSLYASCVRYLQGHSSWQQDPYAAIICLSYQLCHAINDTADNSLRPIETQFRRIWLQSDAQQRALLALLQQSGAALFQLGRFCRDDAGRMWLICQAEPQLTVSLYDSATKTLHKPEQLSVIGWQLQPPSLCAHWHWYHILTTEPLAEQRQASALTPTQIRQLNPNWSISRQVAALQQHPELTQCLLQLASAHAREQIAITDLRHALAMLGTDQLAERLLQSWVLQQIRQNAHPWQAWFAGFTAVLSQSLQLFSQYQKRLALDAPTADLLACSLSLCLQRVGKLRHLPLQAPPRQHDSLVLQCRRLLWQEQTFTATVVALLAELGISSIWQDTFAQQQVSGDSVITAAPLQDSNLLLQLALHYSEWLYFGGPSLPGQLEATLMQAQQQLALPAQSARSWLEPLLQRTDCHWPLQPFDIL